MAQFQPPVVFTSGQVLTASALNAHVSSAVLLPGAVTDQPDITANTVASNDSLVIHDASASALKEATVSDLLNSSLPITASTISATTSVASNQFNAQANKDINVIAYAGVAVTSKPFTSVSGSSVTITSVAHGLVAGQIITVTASDTAYSGTFRITSNTVDEIVYTLPVAVTPNSGTCSYTKLATTKVTGNEIVTSDLYVDGNTFLSGGLTASGSITYSGTSNFTGTLQVNGSTGYMLTEVVEENITNTVTPSTTAFTNIFTSASYTKAAGEIWIIEVDFRFRYDVNTSQAFRLQQTTPSTTLSGFFNIEGGGSVYTHHESGFLRYIFQGATTFTSTFTFDAQHSTAGVALGVGETTYVPAGTFTGVTFPASKFRIYKYKTA